MGGSSKDIGCRVTVTIAAIRSPAHVGFISSTLRRNAEIRSRLWTRCFSSASRIWVNAPLLQRQHIDLVVRRVDPGRVADDVDQPVERVQAAEQVVVLAVGARQERREMAEADALEARRFRRSP